MFFPGDANANESTDSEMKQVAIEYTVEISVATVFCVAGAITLSGGPASVFCLPLIVKPQIDLSKEILKFMLLKKGEDND